MWPCGSSRLHKRYKGERRRKDFLPRREIAEVLHCLSRVPFTLTVGAGSTAAFCPMPWLLCWDVPLTKDPFRRNVFWETSQHNCRRKICPLLTLITVWRGNQRVSDTWGEQQHEREVPRLTRRAADLRGQRDNLGNRRLEKMWGRCALIKTITKIACSEKERLSKE